MKVSKRIILCGAAALLCVSVLGGCNSTAETPDTKSSASQSGTAAGSAANKNLNDTIRQTDGIQPGAKVETGKDEQGNDTFTYENPDGTGGGGVILD